MITITYLKNRKGKPIRGYEALNKVKEALNKEGLFAKIRWQ